MEAMTRRTWLTMLGRAGLVVPDRQSRRRRAPAEEAGLPVRRSGRGCGQVEPHRDAADGERALPPLVGVSGDGGCDVDRQGHPARDGWPDASGREGEPPAELRVRTRPRLPPILRKTDTAGEQSWPAQ